MLYKSWLATELHAWAIWNKLIQLSSLPHHQVFAFISHESVGIKKKLQVYFR